MNDGWAKARNSKYRHYYRDGRAICGSKARVHVFARHYWMEEGKLCPKCDRIREQEARGEA